MNTKTIFAMLVIPILLLLNFSAASAKNVALAVMNTSSLDPVHEQPLYNILIALNENITLVDQNTYINWNRINLLVITGRPYRATPLPAFFAANLPVNTVPTIAIDYFNLYNWGWTQGGANIMITGSPQRLYITTSKHPITAGYLMNQQIEAMNQSGFDAVDLAVGTTNLTFVANLDAIGDGGVAFAAPNTVLSNGQQISANSAAIYFGVMYPAFWTNDTVTIFENAVNWITNLNYVPPTTPTLNAPSQIVTPSLTYSWSASSGVNGIQNYEIQVSTEADFSQIIADQSTSAQSFTYTRLMDGQLYYGRVRSVDFLNLKSQWSSTASTFADFTPMILNLTSPSDGSTFNSGNTIFVNLLVNSPRVQTGSLCTISIDQDLIANLTFNQTTGSCFGNITIPTLSPGPSSTTLTATAHDIVGGTNSTSINVNIPNRVASSTTTTTTTQAAQTSSSGTSGSSSSYYTILTLTSPQKLDADAGSTINFPIIIKNEGNVMIHGAKAWVVAEGSAFSADVTPAPQQIFNLDTGQSQQYFVTIQAPSTAGTYYLDVRTLSLETSETAKRIPLLVTEKQNAIDVGIVSIEIPDFVEGATSLTNITLINKGNVPGTANVNLTLPDGWTATQSTASVDILPNQQMTLSFEVTPSFNSGTLTFSGAFNSGNETKGFSYPVPVSSKISSPLSAITASLAATLGNPAIAIPTTIAVAVAFALYYKFRTSSDFRSKYIWPRTIKASAGSVVPKTNQKNNFKPKKIVPSAKASNSAYEKWEKSYRRG